MKTPLEQWQSFERNSYRSGPQKDEIDWIKSIQADAQQGMVPIEQSDFGSGIKSMAQNTLSACKLLKEGTWDIDHMERWLKAVIENAEAAQLKKK